MARKAGRLLWAKAVDPLVWIDRPAIENIARKGGVHAHPSVVPGRGPAESKAWRDGAVFESLRKPELTGQGFF